MNAKPLGAESQRPHPSGAGIHRYAILVCAATFFLIFAGGLVTSTESGLAVPDWPLSFGQVFPKMEGGVFYEHGHRMVAASVGLLTIGLLAWAWIGRERREVRVLAGVALAAVIVQGLLGGLTVLLKLPPAVSISHACLAQAFLCMTVALAAMTGRWWHEAGSAGGAAPRGAAATVDAGASPRAAAVPGEEGDGSRSSTRPAAGATPAAEDARWRILRWLSVATAGTIYVQLILGSMVRHTKAGLAIPTFPLAFGRIWPPLEDPAIRIHFLHRLGAVAVVVLVGALVARIVAAHRDEPALVRPALLLSALTLLQVTLGGITVLSAKAVTPTTFHVVVGAMVLGTAFLIALRSHRLSAALARPAGAEAMGRRVGGRPDEGALAGRLPA